MQKEKVLRLNRVITVGFTKKATSSEKTREKVSSVRSLHEGNHCCLPLTLKLELIYIRFWKEAFLILIFFRGI